MGAHTYKPDPLTYDHPHTNNVSLTALYVLRIDSILTPQEGGVERGEGRKEGRREGGEEGERGRDRVRS